MDEIVILPNEETIDGSPSDEGSERKEYATLANGVLSPRHRKLAEMFASGSSNAEVAKSLDYSEGRVSVLKNNTLIAQEIERIRERIYEDTIASRLKGMSDSALSHLETVLTDKTNRVKTIEKTDVAKWIIEKIDGKAAQKLDIGGNMLGTLLDKLDGLKSSGRTVDDIIDITPQQLPAGESEAKEVAPAPIPDALKDWIDNF